MGGVVPNSSCQHCSVRIVLSQRTRVIIGPIGLPTPVMNCANLVPVILQAKLETTSSSTKRLITVKKYRERNKTRVGAGAEEIPVWGGVSRIVGSAPAQTVLVQLGLPAALVLTEITE